ncbi:MAG: Phenylacetic acid catabolic protein [Nitrospiraceae bacterium]
MFNDKIEAKDFPKMEKEYQDLLKRVLIIQADCEIGGPHIYVNHWVLNAPTPEDQIVVAQTAAEEIDHARKMIKVLRELGVDAFYVLHRPKSEREVEAFKTDMPTWAGYAVFGMLIDRIGRYQLEEFEGCTYLPLERELPKIMEEEQGHITFGEYKCAELCATPEGKQQVQEAVNLWYPKGLDMFGRSDSWRSHRYLEWGLKRRTNEEARKQYIAEVRPVLTNLGLEIPDELANRKYL